MFLVGQTRRQPNSLANPFARRDFTSGQSRWQGIFRIMDTNLCYCSLNHLMVNCLILKLYFLGGQIWGERVPRKRLHSNVQMFQGWGGTFFRDPDNMKVKSRPNSSSHLQASEGTGGSRLFLNSIGFIPTSGIQ